MLSLRIALRYLRSKKSHSAVNIISIVSMAGVAVAAMAMICVLSVFNGFSQLAQSRLSVVDPQLKIMPSNGGVIVDGDSLAAVVAALPGVSAALPELTGQAMAMTGEKQLPVVIHGVPEGFDRVSQIESTIIDGEMLQPDEVAAYATVSVGVAMNLEVRPSYNSVVKLLVPRRTGRINPAAPLASFRSDTLVVSGVYSTDQQEYDVDRLILPLDHARRLLDYTVEATAIDVAVSPDASVASVEKNISAALGNDYVVADRLRQQFTSFRMITVEKWVTFLMLVFILLMASFNILSAMSMLIIEKRRDVAILASLGAPSAMIKRVFLLQGFLVSAVGGFVGMIIGILLVMLQQHFGLIQLGGDHAQMSITTYPVSLQFIDIIIVVAIVAATGLLAGLISAWRLDTSPTQQS